MHPSAQTGVPQGDSFVNHGSFQNVIHGETQRRRSTLAHEENFFRRLQCMRLCIMAALRRYAHKSLRIYMLLFRLHPPPAIILPCTFVNPAGSHKKTCCIQSHTCWCYRGAQYGWHPRNSMQYLPRVRSVGVAGSAAEIRLVHHQSHSNLNHNMHMAPHRGTRLPLSHFSRRFVFP